MLPLPAVTHHSHNTVNWMGSPLCPIRTTPQITQITLSSEGHGLGPCKEAILPVTRNELENPGPNTESQLELQVPNRKRKFSLAILRENHTKLYT